MKSTTSIVIESIIMFAVGLFLLIVGFNLGALSERINPEPIAPPGMEACKLPMPPIAR